MLKSYYFAPILHIVVPCPAWECLPAGLIHLLESPIPIIPTQSAGTRNTHELANNGSAAHHSICHPRKGNDEKAS